LKLAARAAAALLVLLAAASFWILGAAKDMGKGEELQNVEVMDKTMRLVDARRYMMAFNEALSVQCRDCHDLRDFASDAKEMKLEARRMMKMQKSINDTWFAGKEVVTCWTCHGGSLKARATPPTKDFSDSALGKDP
jgi:hypothetical protein